MGSAVCSQDAGQVEGGDVAEGHRGPDRRARAGVAVAHHGRTVPGIPHTTANDTDATPVPSPRHLGHSGAVQGGWFQRLQAFEDAVAYRRARADAPCPDCGPAASGRRCDDHGRDLDLIATSAGPISGLPRDSIVNVTTLMTLDKTGLDSQAGYLPASLMGEVDRGLRRVLG